MRSVLTILAGACCASLALAQPATRTETRSSTTTASYHRITTVVGTAFSLGNENIGKVVDVVFDNGGCIEYVLVQDAEGFVVVPWAVVTVNYDQKVVTVQRTTVTVDKLREVPVHRGPAAELLRPVVHPEDDDRVGRRAGRSGRPVRTGSGHHDAGPEVRHDDPPDRKDPGTTTPDRKSGTTPPDRTNPKAHDPAAETSRAPRPRQASRGQGQPEEPAEEG